MKCSIIIPLYNKEKCISATIKSVLAQTYKDFELLVVDDGSTDGSADIAKSFNDERIRYIRKENGGVSSARNRGVVEAIGDWILFLDADDTLDNNCLSTLCKPLTENNEIEISAARFHVSKDGKKKISSRFCFTGIIPHNYKWMFLNRYSLRTGCCIIRKEILVRTQFDENLNRFEDMKCILEWIRNTNIYLSDASVMTYQTDNSQLSSVSADTSKDFIFNMNFENKGFWEKCLLGKLLYLGWISYPQEHRLLHQMYRKYYLYMLLAKFQLIINHFHI